MKHHLTISACIAAGIATIALIGCTDIDTSKGDFSKDVSVHSGSTVLPLAPSDPIVTDVESWIRKSEPKWKRTYTTYAPDLVIRNSHFTLNLHDEVAVLNFKPDPSKEKWVQVEREYDRKNVSFIESLRVRIGQAKQAGTGQPGIAPESESSRNENLNPESKPHSGK